MTSKILGNDHTRPKTFGKRTRRYEDTGWNRLQKPGYENMRSKIFGNEDTRSTHIPKREHENTKTTISGNEGTR